MGESAWVFAKRFAQIGFLLGGLATFSFGYREFNPPPLPPGTALCGNEVMAGLVIMILGTPLGSLAGALVGGLLGGILEGILRADSRREPYRS